MGASVSVSGRYCVRFRRIPRGPPAGRRPPPGAGRLAGWRGRCAGPGARVVPSGQDSGAAGSRPAPRAAGIAGPEVRPAGTAVSSAPRITAAEEPQGPRRTDWPRRPDRIIVAISAANPRDSSPPAANVAATSTTSAAGVTTARMGTRPPRRPRSSLCSRAQPGLRPDGGADAARAAMTARRLSGRWPGFWAKAAGPRSQAGPDCPSMPSSCGAGRDSAPAQESPQLPQLARRPAPLPGAFKRSRARSWWVEAKGSSLSVKRPTGRPDDSPGASRKTDHGRFVILVVALAAKE